MRAGAQIKMEFGICGQHSMNSDEFVNETSLRVSRVIKIFVMNHDLVIYYYI